MERKAANASAAAALTGAATDLVGELRDELGRLERKVIELEKRDRENKRQIELMREDLRREVVSKRELSQKVAVLTIKNAELVAELHEERQKRQALEEKLNGLINDKRQGG